MQSAKAPYPHNVQNGKYIPNRRYKPYNNGNDIISGKYAADGIAPAIINRNGNTAYAAISIIPICRWGMRSSSLARCRAEALFCK